MSYIEDHTLVKGDSIVMNVKKNPLFLIPVWICGILFCWLLFIPTIQAVRLTVGCFCTEYAVTTKKIVEKYGLFHIHVDEMPLKKVENITVNKTFFGRIFNYGCICIQGTNRNNINFTDIKDADDVKRKISELIEEGPLAVAEEVSVTEPIPGEPLTEEPVIGEPIAEEPSTEEPVIGEPVAEESTAEEPSTEESTAGEPTEKDE